MTPSRPARTAIAAAVLAALPTAALADSADTLQEIDTVTIIGKRTDVSDIPGSAHVVDSEALAEFAGADRAAACQTNFWG